MVTNCKYLIYIDEKGTQETIQALGNLKTPYDDRQKIELGTDKMKDFVAAAVLYEQVHAENIEQAYLKLEEQYKNTSQKYSNSDVELKGNHILKKNFKYGVADLNGPRLTFYNRLIDMLSRNQVKTHVFLVNKISLAVDKRFKNWLIKVCDRYDQIIYFNLAYSLIKYIELEASKEVIQALFNPNISNTRVLKFIHADIKKFVRKHTNSLNKRMLLQLNNYKQIIAIIDKYAMYLIDDKYAEQDRFITLDWKKAVFNMDLWLTELKLERKSATLHLDEGFKAEIFNDLHLNQIHADLDSKNFVGLRIADVLVVFIGNYISKLTYASMYDKDNPYKQKFLPSDFFNLTEEQFLFLKKLYAYLYLDGHTYSITNDLYFDSSLLFQTFLSYISEYNNYAQYRSVPSEEHPKRHLKEFAIIYKLKMKNAERDDNLIKSIFDGHGNAIKLGIARP